MNISHGFTNLIEEIKLINEDSKIEPTRPNNKEYTTNAKDE